MTKPTGGSAFPQKELKPLYNEEGRIFGIDGNGMTLRQWYAGMVISGMYANGHYTNGGNKEEENINRSKRAYAQADALIAEGEK